MRNKTRVGITLTSLVAVGALVAGVLVAAAVSWTGCGGSGGTDDPGQDGAVLDAAQHVDGAVDPDGGGPGEDASPDSGTPTDPAAPLFEQAGSYEITIAGAEDPATVYYPDPPDLGTGSHDFPVALLLQGANVERGYYSQFAERVARYGFVVVVPDHETSGMRGTGLYAEPQQTNEVLDQMVTEDQGSGPVAGAIDTDTLVLLGHSYGGVAGLYAIQEQCDFPFCSGSFTRPAALAGGAFYGTNMKPPFGSIPPVENDGLPVAYIQGDLDGKALLADTQETYDKTQDPPKLLVEITGANHYGICDQDNPPGAQADSNTPTLDQSVAVETTARWAALFLRATVLADPDAQDYLSNTGPTADPNVTVTYAP